MPRSARLSKQALLVTVGDDNVASSRVRAASVAEQLGADGWNVRRVSAAHGSWPVRLIAGLVRKQDLVLLQKVVPPAALGAVVRLRTRRLVFELDDAIHLGYPGESPSRVSKVRDRIRAISTHADLIVTSNLVLAEDIRALAAADVPVAAFPGPSPAVCGESGARSSTNILWLGSPSTYPYLAQGFNDAARALRAEGFMTRIVGAPADAEDAGGVVEQTWSPHRQVEALAWARIGVMPMAWDAWSERKAAYKVLEYLSAGIVPVAMVSPAIDLLLGDERDRLGVFLEAQTEHDWIAGVRAASALPRGKAWRQAQRAVLERWNARGLTDLITGGADGHSEEA